MKFSAASTIAMSLALANVVVATPPACLLACVASVSKDAQCASGIQDFSCICETNGSKVIDCLESACPSGDADTAISALKSDCSAQSYTLASASSKTSASASASSAADSSAAASSAEASSAYTPSHSHGSIVTSVVASSSAEETAAGATSAAPSSSVIVSTAPVGNATIVQQANGANGLTFSAVGALIAGIAFTLL